MSKTDIKGFFDNLIHKIKSNFKERSFESKAEAAILALPFLLMAVIIYLFTIEIEYFKASIILPNLIFTLLWITALVFIAKNIGGIAGRIIYSVFFGIFFLMFTVNVIYFPYTGYFFTFNLLESADEGNEYILSTVLNAGIPSYLAIIAVLAAGIFAVTKFQVQKKHSTVKIICILLIFVLLQFFTPMLYGSQNDFLSWDTWGNPGDIYARFSDSNKSMKVCGFFQYCTRDFYMTFLKPDDKPSEQETVFLENEYSTLTPHKENEYTGIFEGKNVIFVQIEGADNWLINEKNTPNIHKMLDNSIIFDNHYSYYNGGGSTFNSEFAVSTGFLTPVSYVENAYNFSKNAFPHSLPRQLKKLGYSVNAFHMNHGEYYTRRVNYRGWGYDNYHSLVEQGGYKDNSHKLDTELINNKDFYDKMFKSGKPFMHYIITYTCHMPFEPESDRGMLLSEKMFDGNIPDYSEEEMAKLYIGETDRMFGLLMEALEDNGLIDNTIIVAYSDHYLYTLNDKSILDKYKETSNNLINHTPFFIWSNDISETHISKVSSQLDILPTVLNMLGVEYCDEYYIGNDIMNESHKGYVFFSDFSWYDGENYVEDGKVTNGGSADDEYIAKTSDLINRRIQKNDLTLKFDYLKNIS